MRGDRPELRLIRLFPLQFTPHARGSTHVTFSFFTSIPVYPACAGIDPPVSAPASAAARLPRMRGDRPVVCQSILAEQPFTPHARGSTLEALRIIRLSRVYPACAGIDLSSLRHRSGMSCLPRMRGDRPHFRLWKILPSLFTPHARGSTFDCRISSRVSNVYPACAGIDPTDGEGFGFVTRLPRMRGDRPS